jgi:anhydro-N-acetylmuramic acid kinase
MKLSAVAKKESLAVLGLNSGTSADGVDMALVRYTLKKNRPTVAFLEGWSNKYPPDLRALILRAAGATSIAPEELIGLDNLLGRFYGTAAAKYLERLSQAGRKVDAIASHGQTVRHRPQKIRYSRRQAGGTLQLGSLDQIAAATGKLVVGDFRQADIALGNEGAPITVSAMAQLFSDRTKSRLIVNIGGIANYFYFPSVSSRRRIRAADCGPGNSLCDLLAGRLFGESLDKNGRHARAGALSKRLLSLLLAHPFLRSREKSTGREEFGFDMVEKIISAGEQLSLSAEDMLATASEFTALTVAAKVIPLIRSDRSVSKLYLTGGGERNSFIRERLSQHLSGVSLGSVRELGIDPRFVEAAAFAVMGAAALNSRPLRTAFRGNRPQAVQPVLGKIVQPPQEVRT